MNAKVKWHRLEIDAVCAELACSRDGLAETEAAERLAAQGPNAIVEQARRPVWRMLADQFTDFMILVLVVAAVVAGVVGEPQDSLAIIVIVVLNALVGAVQEYRAERAVEALRRIAAPDALVLRDGRVRSIPARELVDGDVVQLEAGGAVPADVRLFESFDLQAEEAALTGESHPVLKTHSALQDEALPLGDRSNMAFKGTLITHGHGRGLVVATGMQTELGRIADMLQGTELSRTPLQRRLTSFSQRLAVAILCACVVFFAIGLLRGEPVVLMFLTAVSLAVAAIPEALPAVITVSLALGAAKMSRRNVLIRRLPAVESLGSVTYICSDKTGTLTENSMRLERFAIAGKIHEDLDADGGDAMVWLGRALALSNDVVVNEKETPTGEPTELALLQAAADSGFSKAELEDRFPRLAELPFDPQRKRMSTVHRDGKGAVLLCKGAPEVVLPRCVAHFSGDRFVTEAALQDVHSLANDGYRVLALAIRRLPDVPAPLNEDAEKDLDLLGLVALIDPPREGAHQAVEECKVAGIVPVMITGDHPGTARAIAKRLGICSDDDVVITGPELDAMDEARFEAEVKQVRVYARASPEQKIRIVAALQENGQFVAMTGDGVNDAPALKMADIGVAMGKHGTDVAREAADMVLLDDNFTTIVTAVREGRRIYDNIRKFVSYTMSSNSGEIWTLLLAPFFGLPIPLLPIHILWINLVTDGLPGLAYTAERSESRIMERAPRAPNENIFARGMWQHILWFGLFIAGVSIASQAWAYERGVSYWQTVIFTVLTLSQLFHAIGTRSDRESIVTIGLFTNPAMLAAVAVTIGLQMLVIYVPMLNGIFHTQPLPLADLAACFGFAGITFAAVEVEKWLVRRGLIYRNS